MRLPFRRLINSLIATAITAVALLSTISLAKLDTDEKNVDLLIIHGKLVDGSGAKPRDADVAIRGDKIVFVGNATKAHLAAARTIDASGLIVAPGFIDGHTHTLSDLTNDQTKSNQ